MRRIGVDIGGTHTDLVLIDEANGDLVVHKVPTSVGDLAAAALSGVEELCAKAGTSLSEIEHFMHGTTVATNIALEHNGARVGLITTDGFRDILHIARHKRPLTFSLQLDLPWQSFPLVQRRHRLTVPERIVGPNGRVERALDEEALRDAVRRLVDDGVEAIAVCFLMSFLNPVHEKRAGEIIAEMAPEMFVCLSHEVVPLYREYERFSTTALNAYVGPKTAAYLEGLAGILGDAGLRSDLRLMQSSGAAITWQAAQKQPVSLLMSGPAGGLIGGIWAGRQAGFDNVITLDVGGTSADIGVAPQGRLQFKHLLDTQLGPYNAMVPMAEVDAIGAGGGSIAYVDSGGQFQVGPRSAGADPGPCCYGKGGVEPTATDCLVVLGRIDPARFLGGRQPLDAAKAIAAVEGKLCGVLGMSGHRAALGAIKILTHSMVQAIEVNSVRKGYDPRDFALVAFGGAGPLFAVDIARALGVPTVVIPPAPGLTSALGLLASDVAYDFSQTLLTGTAPESADLERLSAAFAGLEKRARDQLRADGFPQAAIRIERIAECRYEGQGYELRAPTPPGPIDEGFLGKVRSAFDAEHDREYGDSSPDKPVTIVNIRVVGTGSIPRAEMPGIAEGTADCPPAALSSRSAVVFDTDGEVSVVDTPRYDRDRLLAGNVIQGPAVIDQMDSTTVLAADTRAVVDRHGSLIITFI